MTYKANFQLNMNTVASLSGFITENVCRNCHKPVTFPAAYEGMCSQCWMWNNGHTQQKPAEECLREEISE